MLVRHSGAVGLPAPLPDIFSFAVRLPFNDVRYGDVVFASPGWYG